MQDQASKATHLHVKHIQRHSNPASGLRMPYSSASQPPASTLSVTQMSIDSELPRHARVNSRAIRFTNCSQKLRDWDTSEGKTL